MLRFTRILRSDDGLHHVHHDDVYPDDEQDDEDFELRCHWRKLRRQSQRRSALREITPMSWKQSHYHCYHHVSIHFNHF